MNGTSKGAGKNKSIVSANKKVKIERFEVLKNKNINNKFSKKAISDKLKRASVKSLLKKSTFLNAKDNPVRSAMTNQFPGSEVSGSLDRRD